MGVSHQPTPNNKPKEMDGSIVLAENGANSENIENSAPTATLSFTEPFEIGLCLNVSCLSVNSIKLKTL